MNILPIRTLSESDQPIFGINLLNLAKLQRVGLSVASGVAISPPPILLNTLLKHIEKVDKEVFEQRLTIIKKDVSALKIPVELSEALCKYNNFFIDGTLLKKKEEAWIKLLEIWLNEIRSKIWREGFSEGTLSSLSPQAVFFIPGKCLKILAYFNPDLNEVEIKSDEKINPVFLKKIDQFVIEGNKKLFLPQVYYFLIYENNLSLVKLLPFTQTLPNAKLPEVIIPKDKQNKLVKSAVKLFLNLSDGFTISTNLDGVLIEGEKIKGVEDTIFKLVESALSFPGKPIIYKLPEGASSFINQNKILKDAVDSFLTARNIKNLLNIELAIPRVCSTDELLQIKRELASMGVSRRGTLKYWLEFAVPENILNIEDYLDAGIDGVIVDLDNLQKLLGGYDSRETEFYQKQVKALISFLKPSFKVLHKVTIPVLVKGQLAIFPDVLDFLIENGVWGVVVNSPVEAESLPEHFAWLEKRMVLKKFS